MTKTKKKLQETENTRKCSGVKQNKGAQSGMTRTIFTSFGITEFKKRDLRLTDDI
jgi:hypothetical protein